MSEPIKPLPSPFPQEKADEIATKTKIEKVERAAQKLGFRKPDPDLTPAQKILRTSLLSFAIMALLVWGDWLVQSVSQNVWIGTWEQCFIQIKTTIVLFTQVVLAKVKSYLDERKNTL